MRMQYTLTAIDLDGTLLNSRGYISRQNREALLRYERAGGHVVLVSGRSAGDMRTIVEELGLQSQYHIAMMGNQVFSKEKVYPVSFCFTQEQYKTILSILETYCVPYLVSAKDTIYYKRFDGRNVYEYFTHGAGLVMAYKKDIENVRDPYRFNIYVPQQETYDALFEALCVQGVRKYRSVPNIDLIPALAHKGYALRIVAQVLGIRKKQIVSIGDGAIDCELLDSAGLGIALANAVDELKACADVVLDQSNDEDGVAHAIYKYCLPKGSECYV